MTTIPTNPYGRKKVKLQPNQVGEQFKVWAAFSVVNKLKTPKLIADFYGLKREQVAKWAYNVRHGIPLCAGSGKPRLLSQEALQKVENDMDNSVYDLRREEWVKMLHETAAVRAKKLGRSGAAITLSNQTIRRAGAQLGVVSAQAEATTSARALACSEIRNQVSLAAMVESLPEIHPLLMMNFDSTGFTVGGTGAETVEVKYKPLRLRKIKGSNKQKREAPSRGRQVKPDEDDKNYVRYTIKYILLMCAAGFQDDPIFCVSDGNMTDEEFRCYPITGLGVGTNLDNVGHVAIMKERAGNKAFHKWLVTMVVAFAKKLRTFYKLDADAVAGLNIDGESAQVEAMFDDETRALLAEHKVIVGKFPAATTSRNQPADVKNCFRGPKTQNKKISDRDVKDNTFMLDKLKDMFALHNEWLNSEERGERRSRGKKKRYISKKDKPNAIAFDAAHMKMCKMGLLRVQLALQMCMRPHMIRESFQCTGLFPRSTDQILANCLTPVKDKEMVIIKNRMPELVQLFRTQGEIFESDFDRLGILSTHDRVGKSLDELIIIRRRAIILTHPEVVRRQALYLTQEAKRELKRKAALATEIVVGGKKVRLVFNN